MSPLSTNQLASLLNNVINGDASALNQLLESSHERVRRIITKQLYGKIDDLSESVEDVTQEVYLQIIREGQQYFVPSESYLKELEVIESADLRKKAMLKWFFAKSRTQAINIMHQLRRKKYGRGIKPRYEQSYEALSQQDNNQDSNVISFIEPSSTTHNPANFDRWNDFLTFIESLQPELKEVFDFYWFHDFTHAEVAAELNIAVATSISRLAKVKIAIKNKFPDMPYDWSH